MAAYEVSLVESSWLPFRRRSGELARLPPSSVTDLIHDDPIVAFGWSRADFNAAAHELLIGLLATTCMTQAREHDGWRAWWREPPAPEVLAERFALVRDAFILDGPGPRFMQDREELDSAAVPVSGLLIDSPGANTIRNNVDLFVKRGRITILSRAAAAMALYTLQTFAPSGGAGHRTSLRGGGPLTTLLLPGSRREGEPVPLWHRLWANVVVDQGWEVDPLDVPEQVFPWLAPTRVSDKGQMTTPASPGVHPAQAFFGMPRRIRLEFEPNAEGSPCDLTGEVDAVVVRAYRTRNYGTNYAAWGRGHPLTPYYRVKPNDPEWLPVHPQPGRLGYRDWLTLVLADDDKGGTARYAPARAVRGARDRLSNLTSEPARVRFEARLWAAGYDMDNMKARGFVESELPLVVLRDDAHGELKSEFDELARQLVRGAREAAGMLAYAVREALALDSSTDGEARAARDRFWVGTEPDFFAAVRTLAERLEEVADADDAAFTKALSDLREGWRRILRQAAIRLFEEAVPMDVIEERAVERLVGARTGLGVGLEGYGKAGAEFYKALELPPREPSAKKGRKR